MRIVPFAVNVFVVAFHESSPLGVASSHNTVWDEACDAAVVPLAARVTVQVVVPYPPVTVMTSSSILILYWDTGKPAADATFTVVCDELIADVSVVDAPGPTRQMYELDGVKSKAVETLLSRAG
jgi:hypothetical protein